MLNQIKNHYSDITDVLRHVPGPALLISTFEESLWINVKLTILNLTFDTVCRSVRNSINLKSRHAQANR